MTAATLIVDGYAIPLTDDGSGLVGHAEIDGRPVLVHCNVTPNGTRAVSPAKWCAQRA